MSRTTNAQDEPVGGAAARSSFVIGEAYGCSSAIWNTNRANGRRVARGPSNSPQTDRAAYPDAT